MTDYQLMGVGHQAVYFLRALIPTVLFDGELENILILVLHAVLTFIRWKAIFQSWCWL